MQLDGHRQLLRTRYEELVVAVRDALQHAELHRLGDGLVVPVAPEPRFQLAAADPVGLLVRPGAVHLRGQTEHPAEPPPGVPRLQQLLDAGQCVTPVEQVRDLPQPGQMRLPVHAAQPRRSGIGSSPRSW
ncbi:hypothetical protein SCALM49S_04743 [Streptomyces californicus]